MSTYAATYSPNAYRASAVLTASPGQLVVMLYDGARRFLHQAAVAMGERDIPGAHNKLTRAEDIIRHLRNTLDMDQGELPPGCSRSTPSRSPTCARPVWTRIPRRSSRSTTSSASCASPGRPSPTSRSMSAESVEPYEALAALIERELQLVSERSFDELQTLKEVRDELQTLAAGRAAGGRASDARALPPAPEARRDRAPARARGAPPGAGPRPPRPARRRWLCPGAPAGLHGRRHRLSTAPLQLSPSGAQRTAQFPRSAGPQRSAWAGRFCVRGQSDVFRVLLRR